MVTFASGYLVEFFIFFHHLTLETLFQALKLTQMCCINMNISFLEHWQFNHKFAPPSPTHILWKIVHTIGQNMKVSRTQKFQFSNFLVNCEEFGSTAKANIKKPQYDISLMNLEKWEVQLDQHSQIPIFNRSVNLEKVWSTTYDTHSKFKTSYISNYI